MSPAPATAETALHGIVDEIAIVVEEICYRPNDATIVDRDAQRDID
ncbi:MAG: hypothetical protein WDM81_13855 [Rhizomicrobium sp.]